MVKKEKFIHEFVTGKSIPVFDTDIQTFDVNGIRRLRTTWDPVMAEDVAAFHNIDVEAELTALLSERITQEIDREILNDIINMSDEPIEEEYEDPIQPTMGNLFTPSEVTEHNRLQDVRREVVNKWDSLGFLDGLDSHVREGITQRYETQVSALLNEPLNAPPPNTFQNVVFPTVREVFPRLMEDILPHNPPPFIIDQEEFDINWRTDETWEYGGLYGSKIGITMNIKPLDFIPKPKSFFDEILHQNIDRTFV